MKKIFYIMLLAFSFGFGLFISGDTYAKTKVYFPEDNGAIGGGTIVKHKIRKGELKKITTKTYQDGKLVERNVQRF